MATTVEIVSSNTALPEETVVVLKDTVVKKEIEEPSLPVVAPLEKNAEEESIKVEVVAKPSDSNDATSNERVEVAAKEEEEEEEEDDEVVILTDDDMPDDEEEFDSTAEIAKAENGVPDKSSVPEAETPVAKEEVMKK